MNNHKLVVVLGNGFDLDLGLKTKYTDFIESVFFKDNLSHWDSKSLAADKHANKMSIFDDRENPYLDVEHVNIFQYLQLEYDIRRWIDIEYALSKLASRIVRDTENREKRKAKAKEIEEKTFALLHEALCSYLESVSYSCINKESVALKLLRIIKESENSEVLTFNYTDLHRLENYIGPIKIPVDHIHGSIADKSIILGFQDELEMDSSYCFMIKSFSPNFKSHNVREKLLNADEIIFFGHSLGSTDYHYFQDLFRYQSQAEKANKKLIIRIFTYNEMSRRDTLIQLRNMNEKRTDMLYDLCDFEIYRTGEEADYFKIEKYFCKLTTRLGVHYRSNECKGSSTKRKISNTSHSKNKINIKVPIDKIKYE